MHELSIAQGILDIVRQHLPDGPVRSLRSVKVRVGSLSGVVPESLEFCFEAIVGDTPLQGARLEIERVPIRLKCGACGRTSSVEEDSFLCPACGAGDIEVVSGTELQVVELELADGG